MMEETWIPLLILIVSIVGFLWCIIGGFYKAYKRRQQLYLEFEQEIEKPAIERVEAKVIHKRPELLQTGSYRQPKHTIVFFVTFVTLQGEEKEYRVSERVYKSCRVNAKGHIVLENGTVLDFLENETTKP